MMSRSQGKVLFGHGESHTGRGRVWHPGLVISFSRSYAIFTVNIGVSSSRVPDHTPVGRIRFYEETGDAA